LTFSENAGYVLAPSYPIPLGALDDTGCLTVINAEYMGYIFAEWLSSEVVG
jgi:hypothetical protein